MQFLGRGQQFRATISPAHARAVGFRVRNDIMHDFKVVSLKYKEIRLLNPFIISHYN